MWGSLAEGRTRGSVVYLMMAPWSVYWKVIVIIWFHTFIWSSRTQENEKDNVSRKMVSMLQKVWNFEKKRFRTAFTPMSDF